MPAATLKSKKIMPESRRSRGAGRGSAPSQSSLQDDALREEIRELLQTEIDFISNPSFRAKNAEREILGEEETVQPESDSKSKLPKDLPAHLARLCESQLLTAEQERKLFRRMNYLKYLANSIRCKLDENRPDRVSAERARSLLDEANAVRDQIVSANMRLVMSIVKKFVTPQICFDDMLSEGIWSLMQCVDKFDYDRGFRFSTYAYRSIARSSYRKVTERQKDVSRFANGSEDLSFEVEDVGRSSSLDENTWTTLRNLLAGMMHHLDRREQFVIRGRYALGAHRKVRTFQTLADKLGVSKERVRQLEQRAVGKLRNMAANVNLDEMLSAAVA